MPEVSLTEWNTYLTDHPNAHILQMGEWGELKSAFGWDPVRLDLDDGPGAQILFRRLPLGLTLAYLPKPVFSDQLSAISEQFWDKVDEVCKKHRAVFLKIELDAWENELDSTDTSHIVLRTSTHNIQPPRTIIVDLTGTEEEILAHMKQKTRYNIRLADRKGVTVRSWDDLPAFHQMMLITGGRDGFGVHSLEYYQRAYALFHPKGLVELLVAEFEGKPLAALMVFARGRRAWYIYGASNNQERNRMPTYLLQWEAMRWARSMGAEEYDLWGVPDENEETLEAQFTERNDGLWGVYRFKRGFGGELKRAAQALDRVYNPLLYKLYLWRTVGREAD
ncbi:MAG: peptidoglycan bridge formation glycyltransferase FemA/FemB family protein [Anaerolineales bacterium]|jgi:lipid II:glycine glycyltransferase (peptidoglycan interpeptide bridge formation enzyme)